MRAGYPLGGGRDRFDRTYLIVSGAATARRVPDLVVQLAPCVPNLLTVLTPNAQQIVSPRELSLVPGHRVVESYYDDAILPRPPDGVLLVAPCSFNTLNKLALGIADNLALSITAEAIGRGTPVIIAVSVNDPLWAHPRARQSVSDLLRWGVTVLNPVPDDRGYLTMASTETIVDHVLRSIEAS
jgi:phosphopantothenoylcysteine synthetase/decarboxylase